MNIGEEIRRLRKVKKMTLEQLAHEVGTDTGNLSRLERGAQGYTEELLVKIAAALGVKVYQIFARAEGIDLEKKENTNIFYSDSEIEEALQLKKNFVLVPRYNVEASMGPGAIVHSEQVVDYLTFKRNWIERENFRPENLALIDSRGDSMSPTINQGDLLLVDHTPIDKLTNGIYVLNLNGELLAKRLELLFDGSINIISDNKNYPTQNVSAAQIQTLTIVGRVVWAGGRI